MTTARHPLVRILAGTAAVFVLCFSVVTPAQAILPAVAVVEAAVWVGGILIRVAGRRVITSVGVAANDALWASRVVSTTRGVKTLAIGAAAAVGGSEYEYEIQADKNTPLETPSLATPPQGQGSGTSEEDPIAYDNPVVALEFTLRWAGSWMGSDGGLWNENRKFTSVAEAVTELNRVSDAVKPGRWVYRDLRTVAPNAYKDAINENIGWKYQRWGENDYYVIAPPAIIRSARDANGNVCAYPLPANPPVGCDTPGNIHEFVGSYQYTGFTLKEGPDQIRRIVFDGKRFSPDPTDPDWKNYSPDEYKYGFSFTNRSSPNTRVEILPHQGGLSLTAATQAGPDVIYRRLALTAEGNLSSVEESTYTNENVGTLYTNKPSLLPHTDPSTGTSPGTNPGTTPNITFPDDYARENTNKSISTNTADIKNFLGDTNGDLEDPPEPDADQIRFSFFGNTFDNLLAWRLPPHASQCPTASFALWGSLYVVESHCTIFQNQAAPLSMAMLVVWMVLALYIVLKA